MEVIEPHLEVINVLNKQARLYMLCQRCLGGSVGSMLLMPAAATSLAWSLSCPERFPFGLKLGLLPQTEWECDLGDNSFLKREIL